jgi:glycine/D-amino acid oxidase-like deaminating enzyme
MVKQIKGPSDHVVVVGAGYAGLSAALRLAGAGRKVTIIERESVPGGRSGLLQRDGYSFDTGPSVLTMPSLINDAFNSVGEELKDWVDLMPLKPLYRAFYDDGSALGSKEDDECRIDSLCQSWAIISKAAEHNRAWQAMESARAELVDHEGGLIKLLTPFEHFG